MKKKSTTSTALFGDVGLFDASGHEHFLIVPSLDFGSLCGNKYASADSLVYQMRDRRSSVSCSSKLTQLVFLYELFLIQSASSMPALDKFWLLVDRWKKERKLSALERSVLYQASKGDAESIRILINASPYTLKFPFIQDYLIDLLKAHKMAPRYSPTPLPSQKHWLKLLPTRDKNKVLFSDADIKRVVETESHNNKKNPAARASSLLGISRPHQRKVAPVKSGPGRLKKNAR